MQSFLSNVISEVVKSTDSLANTTFVLPNKRAGVFLKNLLKQKLTKSAFFPKILSIEEFVSDISGFEILNNVRLIFEFYHIYKKHTADSEIDDFDSFSKWASILLQDYNDLDSNLFDADAILTYLHDSKRLEQWNLEQQDQTDMLKKYLSFYANIKTYHRALELHLKELNIGYQGLVYRIATERIEEYINTRKNEYFIFAGFNALNKSEEKIIQELLFNDRANIYWDNDVFYQKSNNQSNQFFSQYKNSWPYYNNHEFQWEDNQINTKKNIHLHGLPKNISQIKHVGSLLKDIYTTQGIEDTAVILGNEKLLPALLNSIPKEITTANITMGYELQYTSLTTFFNAVFHLHLNKGKWGKKDSFYHKDLSAVLNDPFFKTFWTKDIEFEARLKILTHEEKSIFITENELTSLLTDSKKLTPVFELLFLGWKENINGTIDRFIKIIQLLRKVENQNVLFQEFLFRFYNIFIQLSNLNKEFGYLDNLTTLHRIFQQILKLEKLSFQGEPLQGLQIMGLLESRALDFKNVIILSVNEGHLPAKGAGNSFIPMDIKLEKGIPAYFEKDAIFSYHFFRLLHRSKNMYLLYNNIIDDFGSGEASRFIRQIEAAKKLNFLDKVNIEKKVIQPKLLSSPISLTKIDKSTSVVSKLQKVANQGFSPTSLINYIRNPMDFYKRSILGIKEFKEVEEIVAATTFGTIVHDSLENLYTPYLNKYLSLDNIHQMKKLLHEEVNRQFEKSYSSKSIKSGKNYLSLEIAKQFVLNFLNFEVSELRKNKKIKITGLEVSISYNHQVADFDFPIKLKGKIDRIDEVDGVIRIMDYKTGKVETNQLMIKDWNLICSEEKFSKAFQVLIYAYVYAKNNSLLLNNNKLESGIVSFKNLNAGFIKLNNSSLSQETLDAFIIQLDALLLEIFNSTVPFIEKELPEYNF